MANQITMVHVTHEAVRKIGGIGAVLQGFFTCNSYLKAVERSIVVGPLFSTEGKLSDRLGEDGDVLYSSIDGFAETEYASAFEQIEKFYNVSIVYGRRTFNDGQTGIKYSPEILLFDVRNVNTEHINEFKKQLFEKFGIRSHLYEELWEYEQYVRLAPAAIAALKAITAAGESTTIVSHEFMGMPTVLAAILEQGCDFGTVFYAHEVATMRRIIEEHPGHDTMFYNVMKQAHKEKLYVNEVFGDQSCYFKHPLIEASKYCDCICAVGNYAAAELRFLGPQFETAEINVVYNGLPAYQIGIAERLAAREKLRQYCKTLLGYKPDYVFTHVTRMVQSKGLWRDLCVLSKMEKEFRSRGKTAVMFLLSTETNQRPSGDIYDMESAYNWPVAHREGWPDLSGGEAKFYTTVQEFNAKSRNIKIVFVNQFGFKPKHCGRRMPADMEFMDIRKGSDVEFGQSIYEPFGISQLEPLTFGGICVVSSVCGCAGFVQDVTNGQKNKNVIIADYTEMNGHFRGNAEVMASQADIEGMLRVGRSVRSQIEDYVSEKAARQVIERLAKSESEMEPMMQAGYSLAEKMSWDVVVENYVLPSLQKAQHKQTIFI